jgi:hypothetical protein
VTASNLCDRRKGSDAAHPVPHQPAAGAGNLGEEFAFFAHTPIFRWLFVLGTLCQFGFDRLDRALETFDDADQLGRIGDPIVLLWLNMPQ